MTMDMLPLTIIVMRIRDIGKLEKSKYQKNRTCRPYICIMQSRSVYILYHILSKDVGLYNKDVTVVNNGLLFTY